MEEQDLPATKHLDSAGRQQQNGNDDRDQVVERSGDTNQHQDDNDTYGQVANPNASTAQQPSAITSAEAVESADDESDTESIPISENVRTYDRRYLQHIQDPNYDRTLYDVSGGRFSDYEQLIWDGTALSVHLGLINQFTTTLQSATKRYDSLYEEAKHKWVRNHNTDMRVAYRPIRPKSIYKREDQVKDMLGHNLEMEELVEAAEKSMWQIWSDLERRLKRRGLWNGRRRNNFRGCQDDQKWVKGRDERKDDDEEDESGGPGGGRLGRGDEVVVNHAPMEIA